MWCSRHIRLFAIIIGFVLISGLCRSTFAGERAAVPVIPKALAGAERGHAELMRRDHMDLMIHKRDETVHQGVRTKRYSLHKKDRFCSKKEDQFCVIICLALRKDLLSA